MQTTAHLLGKRDHLYAPTIDRENEKSKRYIKIPAPDNMYEKYKPVYIIFQMTARDKIE